MQVKKTFQIAISRLLVRIAPKATVFAAKQLIIANGFQDSKSRIPHCEPPSVG